MKLGKFCKVLQESITCVQCSWKQKDAGNTLLHKHKKTPNLLFQGSYRNCSNNCIVIIQGVWVRVEDPPATTPPMASWTPCTPSMQGRGFWACHLCCGSAQPKGLHIAVLQNHNNSQSETAYFSLFQVSQKSVKEVSFVLQGDSSVDTHFY